MSCYTPQDGGVVNYGLQYACPGSRKPGSAYSQCCTGDVGEHHCLPDGFCHFAANEGPALTSGYYLSGCTDPSFAAEECPQHCLSYPTQDVVYLPQTGLWACCYGSSGVLDCSNPGNETWAGPAPAKLLASASASIFAATATTTSTSSKATATATVSSTIGAASSTTGAASSNDTSSSSSSTSTIVPAVVVPIVVLLILGLLAFWLIRRRRRRNQPISQNSQYYEGLSHTSDYRQPSSAGASPPAPLMQERYNQAYQNSAYQQNSPERGWTVGDSYYKPMAGTNTYVSEMAGEQERAELEGRG